MGAGAPVLSLESVSPPTPLWGTSGFSLCVFALVYACVAGRGSCHREKINWKQQYLPVSAGEGQHRQFIAQGTLVLMDGLYHLVSNEPRTKAFRSCWQSTMWVGPEGQGCCQWDHWEVGPEPLGSLLLIRALWERQACQDQSLACVKVITTVRKMWMSS